MKLCGIWIVWDDWDLLEHSINAIMSELNGIIIVASERSTTGEFSPIPDEWRDKVEIYEPHAGLPQRDNERAKRNFGLNLAKKRGFSHFLMLDADEFYEAQAIKEGKAMFDDPNLNGIVCGSKIYIRTPELCIDDITRVPFIHKLTPDLEFKKNYSYPHSCGHKGIFIDPTRTLNLETGVIFSRQIIMHHMTLIRKDVRKKIRNSSGDRIKQYGNLMIEDYKKAKPGYRLRYYNLGEESATKDRVLQQVPNTFNIPAIEDLALLGSVPTGAQFGQVEDGPSFQSLDESKKK